MLVISVPPMLVEVHLIVKFPSDIAHGVYLSLILHMIITLPHIICAGLFYCTTNKSAFSEKSSMIFAV